MISTGTPGVPMIRHGELLSTVEAPDMMTPRVSGGGILLGSPSRNVAILFQVTLLVTVVGTLMLLLGSDHCYLIRVLPKPLSWLVTWIANFILMTPIVVQLLVVFYGFVWMEPMTIALVVYGVHYSTYMSEVYRAGIDSVPTGQ